MSRRNSRRRQQGMNAWRRAHPGTRCWLDEAAEVRPEAWSALRDLLRNGPPIRIERAPLIDFGLPVIPPRWVTREEMAAMMAVQQHALEHGTGACIVHIDPGNPAGDVGVVATAEREGDGVMVHIELLPPGALHPPRDTL